MDVPQMFFSVEVFPDKFGMFICLTDGCALWVGTRSGPQPKCEIHHGEMAHPVLGASVWVCLACSRANTSLLYWYSPECRLLRFSNKESVQ